MFFVVIYKHSVHLFRKYHSTSAVWSQCLDNINDRSDEWARVSLLRGNYLDVQLVTSLCVLVVEVWTNDSYRVGKITVDNLAGNLLMLLAIRKRCFHVVSSNFRHRAARDFDSILDGINLGIDYSFRDRDRANLSLSCLVVGYLVSCHALGQFNQFCSRFALLLGAYLLVVLLTGFYHCEQNLLGQSWQTFGVWTKALEWFCLSPTGSQQESLISGVGKVRKSMRKALL